MASQPHFDLIAARIQVSAGGFRRVQVVSGECRWLQVNVGGCRWMQVVAGECRWLQVNSTVIHYELSDAIYKIKLASLDSKISQVFCHILIKNLLVRKSVPTQKLESLRYAHHGRQRERHNSFLCFPSKKLRAKIYYKGLTGQFMRQRIQEIFTKENKTKASIRIPEKRTSWLQTLQFGRGTSRNLKTVFPTLCDTTRQLHA